MNQEATAKRASLSSNVLLLLLQYYTINRLCLGVYPRLQKLLQAVTSKNTGLFRILAYAFGSHGSGSKHPDMPFGFGSKHYLI